jgi:hypothetical protein
MVATANAIVAIGTIFSSSTLKLLPFSNFYYTPEESCFLAKKIGSLKKKK